MAPTLLLADDNATIQRLVEMTFAEHGIDVISVSTGQEAIDHLTVRRPDIALVGVRLESRDGYEVAGFIQREPSLRGVPVLLVAGAFDTVDEARVRDSGAVGVLFKPFESTQVINRVKELLGLSAKETDPTARERAAAPQPGRLLTSSEGPARRDSMAAPSVQRSPLGADTKAATESGAPMLTQQGQPSKVAREGAAAQEPDAGGESYFGHLDEAFDSLDAQVARQSAPADRGSDTATSPPPHALPGAADSPPNVGTTGPSVASTAESMGTTDASAASPRFAQGGAVSASMAGGNPGFTADDDWLLRSGTRESGSGSAVSPAMADAFALILAQEQGERLPEHDETPRDHTVYPAPIELSDDVIDRIAQRVVDRLIAGPLGERVTRAANDVSERLVREEIARIRASATPRKP